MIIVDVEQGSPEWFEARLGIPTASEFRQIFTSQGKPSTSAKTYRNKLLAEWLMGHTPESYSNDWMARGTELEPEAREYYTLITDVAPDKVGFCHDDDRTMGCSPDGFIGENGGLEIKCPAPHTQVDYLLRNKLPPDYVPQIQGAMYITGRQWWDFLSYHPELPPVLIRVDRDQPYIDKLAGALGNFVADLRQQQKKLEPRTEMKIYPRSDGRTGRSADMVSGPAA